MRTVVLILAAVAGVAACKPPDQADGPVIDIEGVLNCQNAVAARGFQGASFEQVDAQPGRNPPVTGFVVLNGQRRPFTCTLDGANQVTGVTVDGQPR